jgi:hypothetical protein
MYGCRKVSAGISVAEQQDLLSALPVRLLWGEIARRGELARRCLGVPAAVGSIASTGAVVSLEWLPDQYDLSIAALGEL